MFHQRPQIAVTERNTQCQCKPLTFEATYIRFYRWYIIQIYTTNPEQPPSLSVYWLSNLDSYRNWKQKETLERVR